MPSPLREDSFYRRGLVLGLTMAEIVILIIFVLLLALSVMNARKEREFDRLTKESDERDRQIEILVEKLKHFAGRAPTDDTYDEIFHKLVLARKEIADLKDRTASLVEDNRQLAAKTVSLEKEIETFIELQRLIDEATGERDQKEGVTQLLTDIETARTFTATIQEFGLPADNLGDLKAKLGEAVMATNEVETARDEIAKHREQAEYYKRLAGGRSNEMPPCWIHPLTKKSEYIFDVVLMSAGILIHDRKVPHRKEDQAALPLDPIEFDRVLSGGKFLLQTRPLFQWSEGNACRFYVQVFDKTGPTEKSVYKQRLKTVEDHFYKYLPEG